MNVFPLLVCPYARIVQLYPSKNRDRIGLAVDSNISYWVVEGPWTWSKVKVCFLAAPPVETAGAPAFARELETGSIETEVEELAWMTERWKRWGMDWESWLVGGRIRRAARRVRLSSTNTARRIAILTDLYRGRRRGRRARGCHDGSVQRRLANCSPKSHWSAVAEHPSSHTRVCLSPLL